MDQLWKMSIESLPGEPADEVQNMIWRASRARSASAITNPEEHRLKCPIEYREWLKKNRDVLEELMLVW